MMRLRMLLAMLLLLVAMLALTTGCGEKGSTSTPIQQPTESPASSPPVTAQYEIFIEPRMLDDSNVEAFITTNIPGEIEVVADLALVADLVLASQAPDGVDVWVIGTHSRHVSVCDGEGTAILDGSELPTGEYAVEVALYPWWGLKDDVSRSCGINQDLGYSIDATATVTLTGSGESVEDVRRRNEGRRWVMSNFRMGQKWDPAFWRAKFGEWKQLEVDRYNPAIIKAYYFESIDMTLIVNVLKGEIDTWRDGEAHH